MNVRGRTLSVAALWAALSACVTGAAGAATVDLTHAVVVTAAKRNIVERNACRLLVEEAAKRCGVTMRTATTAPATGAVIYLGTRANPPKGAPAVSKRNARRADGYTLRVSKRGRRAVVVALGNDRLGCVFAAGRLLREMSLAPGKITAPVEDIVTAPAEPVRIHQIGWRPGSNTYDKWGPKQFEQYVRDMAIWGCNGLEVIPIESSEPFDPYVTMNVKFANILTAYGMKVWFWYPLDDQVPPGVTGNGLTPGQLACPSRPDGRKWMLDRRRKLFKMFKHIDAVFIPGGDPQGCNCDLCKPWVHTMMPLVAEIAKILRETHPEAQLWLSNQGFRGKDNDWFYNYIRTNKPKWLHGVVYGPWAEETIESMRKRLPKRYPICQYPDITHTARCQFPQPDWDVAFDQTLGREPAAYRVMQEPVIARRFLDVSCGAASYSEGINDDYHKVVWNMVLWDPKVKPLDIARGYARYFFGPQYEKEAVEGLVGLERNWKAPLLTNRDVLKTYAIWRDLAHKGGAKLAKNWRFEQALMRATYDRFVQLRLQTETAEQNRILANLAADPDPAHAVTAGIAAVDAALSKPEEPAMQARLIELGQAMYDLIGAQLSVKRWGASGGTRGAIMDYLDAPITDLNWIKAELTKLQGQTDPAAVRTGIDEIVNWTSPGPGGFYDDLGNPTMQPHLVEQLPWAQDPGFVRSTQCGTRGAPPDWRMSWIRYAETLYGVPIIMRYTGLDRDAQYVVRVMYTGRYSPTQILTADDKYLIHGPLKSPSTPTVLEFPIPQAATASGTLRLKWDRTEGRGAQVSEVWLERR